MNPERLSENALVNSGGDIVPPDDVPEAKNLLVNEEIIEDLILSGEAESAKELEKFSDVYRDVVALIEAGIEKSRGYKHYKVEYNGKLVPLGFFLATALFKMDLSDEERNAILDKYIPIDLAHESAKHAEAVESAFEVYYDLYDQIAAKHPGGAAEIHALAQAEARRRGIAIPPHL